MQSGSSNVENGVTIDLRNFNHIQVSDDQSTTKVGPGVKMGDLYEMLDGMGLSVISGRDSNVGVGGITLGGAVSAQRKRCCD
jgi:FAD/FMN-containing dehydrogenase